MYAVGDTVQDFTLPNQDGEMITLSSFQGQKVLVWFYPKASTPGCTAEGCSIRDNFAALQSANVVVYIIEAVNISISCIFFCRYSLRISIG